MPRKEESALKDSAQTTATQLLSLLMYLAVLENFLHFPKTSRKAPQSLPLYPFGHHAHLHPVVKHFQEVSEPQWEMPGTEVHKFSRNYASTVSTTRVCPVPQKNDHDTCLPAHSFAGSGRAFQ